MSCSWLEYRLWKWCKTWSKVKHKRSHLWSLSGCSTFWCSKKYNNSNTTLPTNLLFVLLFSLFVLLFSVVLSPVSTPSKSQIVFNILILVCFLHCVSACNCHDYVDSWLQWFRHPCQLLQLCCMAVVLCSLFSFALPSMETSKCRETLQGTCIACVVFCS